MTNLLIDKVKPTGFTQAQEVDIWYELINSLETLTEQLDADGGVTDTDYEANAHTAITNMSITNSQGNTIMNHASDLNFYTMGPGGITDEARLHAMYNFTNSWETLCEQLDADGTVNDTNYEALCFTATFLHIIRDPRGVTDLGNGTVFYFGPGGSGERKNLVEWFYNAYYSLSLLTAKLDADSGVTDTDYEANCYTATCLMQIQNLAGSVIGN